MELFNIGPLEFILIILFAVVFVGPERMVKGAYSLGRWINKFVRSPMWKEIMSTSRDIRELPTKIVRESGLEESLNEIKQTSQELTTELNSTLQEANAEVKQAVEEANAEVRQATNELNDTTRQAISEVNQEVGKIGSPADLSTGSEIVEAPTVDPGETQVVDQAEGQSVETPAPQPTITLEQVLAAALESPSVDPVEQQTADNVELKPMPVLSHLQEVLPEILPLEPSKLLPAEPAMVQPTIDPAGPESAAAQVPLEELYEAKLNRVLEQYEVELKKILEQYKADLKRVAPPVEEPSPPVEATIQDKLE
jgi:Sec-independent protein translocase protein TatA